MCNFEEQRYSVLSLCCLEGKWNINFIFRKLGMQVLWVPEPSSSVCVCVCVQASLHQQAILECQQDIQESNLVLILSP